MNCTPKVRHKTFGVQFNYEAFIKEKLRYILVGRFLEVAMLNIVN